MIRFLLCAWWIVLMTFTASAQLPNHRPNFDTPDLPRDRLIAFLDAFEIHDEARAEALAVHDRLAAAYTAAWARRRDGYAQVNQAQRAWLDEHRSSEKSSYALGLDFGSAEVQTNYLRDRFEAEEAFRRTMLALPALDGNEAARAALIMSAVRRELEWLRTREFGSTPRFRDLYLLNVVVDESDVSGRARELVAPLLHAYADQMLAAALAWRAYSINWSIRTREMQIYGIDLGTERVNMKLDQLRAYFAEQWAMLDRMIAINRQFTAQVAASLDDDADRRAVEQRLEMARFPEYCVPSPAHRVLEGLREHPAVTETERAAIAEAADAFEQQWQALKNRLIATATSGETPAFLRHCDEAAVHPFAYRDGIKRHPEGGRLEVIHPCEPLIIERERLVKSTLRALAALLSDNTKRRLDADIGLIFAWGATGEIP